MKKVLYNWDLYVIKFFLGSIFLYIFYFMTVCEERVLLLIVLIFIYYISVKYLFNKDIIKNDSLKIFWNFNKYNRRIYLLNKYLFLLLSNNLSLSYIVLSLLLTHYSKYIKSFYIHILSKPKY